MNEFNSTASNDMTDDLDFQISELFDEMPTARYGCEGSDPAPDSGSPPTQPGDKNVLKPVSGPGPTDDLADGWL